MKVDLLWLATGGEPPSWPPGEVVAAEAAPAAVAAAFERLARGTADAVLSWDARLGPPDAGRVAACLERPIDVWHAGLCLGLAGSPALIDRVAPTWMLQRDPDPEIEATSWRLSLRAALIRSEVLRRLGGPRPEFTTLSAAGLELGHRFATRGALVRHVPELVTPPIDVTEEKPGLADEARLVACRHGHFWARWALLRATLAGEIGPTALARAWRSATPPPAQPSPFRPPQAAASASPGAAGVGVLIPTLDRYPYLRTLLDQLRRQTVPAAEIVVVDQTPRERRDNDVESDFADLPLTVLHLDQPGQCSSRNAGLERLASEYILFLDDDDEIAPDLIARHLAALERFGADVSCGVAEEVGAGPLPPDFTYSRLSDVFPTNNSLVRRKALYRSGLFDLAYERGSRADGDLGMRLYLSGALMVLSPEISVLHHHAPRGGLRHHRARVVTYASSRRRLLDRHLPSVTEIYLARRYFSPRQVREMLWLRTMGTLRLRGGRGRQLLKLLVGMMMLPDTLLRTVRRAAAADAMLDEYPQIPHLER